MALALRSLRYSSLRPLCRGCRYNSSLTTTSTVPRGGILAKIIRDSIKSTGPLPISRYIQFCLSHPTEGYYTQGDVFGKQGDFITSPEISQVFGELVAIWLLTRWMADGSPARCRLVELGPGRGTLMDDILRTLSRFPIYKTLTSVHLVDNSLKMQAIQQKKLEPRVGSSIKLEWHDWVPDVPKSDEYTLLVAHEFFDAMPFNLFEKTDEGFREVFVDIDPSYGPSLPTSSPSGLRLALSKTPTTLSTVLPTTSPRFAALPQGSRVEISQESWKIMRNVGELLRGETGAGGGGAGLVVDYGGDRSYGSSFRAFRGHKIVDVFEEPGTADLTANVDFAYLKESLEGIARPLGPVPQSNFLLSLGLQPRLESLLSKAPADRRGDIEKGAKRLVDNSGMGSQYQIMGIVSSPLDKGVGPGIGEEVYPFPLVSAVQPIVEADVIQSSSVGVKDEKEVSEIEGRKE